MLPESVLAKAASEMLDYQGTGESVMEMSHRSKEYQAIIDGCEALLREVMGIPDNYKVLFLQGGASSQFAMVPMNLMTGSGKADFVITGQWATKAYKEASRYGDCKAVASSKDKTFSYIPKLDPAEFRPTRIISTSASTTRSTAPSGMSCPTPAAFRSWRTSPPASSPSRST